MPVLIYMLVALTMMTSFHAGYMFGLGKSSLKNSLLSYI